jgi:hypothetical protein
VKRPAIFAMSLIFALCICTQANAAEPFAHGCPQETLEEGAVGKLNHNPAARQAIVPAGAISMRICRYYGFGEFAKQTPKTQARAGELQDQAVVQNRDLLESLTLEFKELEAAPAGAHGCPADEGAELYAVFFYRYATKPVVLHVSLSGCRFVVGGAPRARWLNGSLQKKLVRLAAGKHVKAPAHSGVKKRGAVAYGPPHLSYARAKHGAKGVLEYFCKESKLCASQSIGKCTRINAKALHCRYSAELHSGEVCRGWISIKAIEGRMLLESPGLLSSEEGECFYLFAPPGLKESEEAEEHEEAQEAEKGKRSSKAIGQPGKQT